MIHWPVASPAHVATWLIAAAATAAVIIRPGRWPEAVWAGAGALALLACGLLPIAAALQAVLEGWDVTLFGVISDSVRIVAVRTKGKYLTDRG